MFCEKVLANRLARVEAKHAREYQSKFEHRCGACFSCNAGARHLMVGQIMMAVSEPETDAYMLTLTYRNSDLEFVEETPGPIVVRDLEEFQRLEISMLENPDYRKPEVVRFYESGLDINGYWDRMLSRYQESGEAKVRAFEARQARRQGLTFDAVPEVALAASDSRAQTKVEQLQDEYARDAFVVFGGAGAKTTRGLTLDRFKTHLRNTLKRKLGTDVGIAYRAVNEYGDRSERPHYHLILLLRTGEPKGSPRIAREVEQAVRHCWKFGDMIQVDQMNVGGANYVCGYTMKKMLKPVRTHFFENGRECRIDGSEPERSTVSRNVGYDALRRRIGSTHHAQMAVIKSLPEEFIRDAAAEIKAEISERRKQGYMPEGVKEAVAEIVDLSMGQIALPIRHDKGRQTWKGYRLPYRMREIIFVEAGLSGETREEIIDMDKRASEDRLKEFLALPEREQKRGVSDEINHIKKEEAAFWKKKREKDSLWT